MVTKKDRRKSGYVTPQPTISKKDLIENDLFINPFYDDWEDYRDGLRDWFGDNKKIKSVHHYKSHFELVEERLRMNKKQKKLLKRRQAKIICSKNRNI